MSQGLTPEFALGYRAMMIDGLKREAATTKKVIAAIPEDKTGYKPDEHARTAWELAWHIADTDVDFLDGIADLKFTMDHGRDGKPTNITELAAWYEKHMARGLARVEAMSAEQLMTPVDFYGVFNLPSAFYLGFLNNHSIHHRGALATYLRPMGAKVPSIYGGSYDEPFQMPASDETAA